MRLKDRFTPGALLGSALVLIGLAIGLTVFVLPQSTDAIASGCGDPGAPYGCPDKQYPKVGTIASAGNVSVQGQYANTEILDSFFEVTDVAPSTISVKIRYTCSAGKVGFKIYIRSKNGSWGSPKVDGTTACSAGSGAEGVSSTGTFTIPAGSKSADGLYYAADVRVSAVNYGGNGGHLPFNIIVGGNNDPWISYADQGILRSTPPGPDWRPAEQPFGIWMSAINFGFRAPCDWKYGDEVFFKWSGADIGTDYQPLSGVGSPPKPMSAELFDYTTGETVWSSSYYPTLNGKNSLGVTNEVASASIKTLRAGHKYIWRWRNVASNNSMALSVPFNQSSWYVSCDKPDVNKPPTGAFGLACNSNQPQALFSANDPDSPGTALQYAIRRGTGSDGGIINSGSVSSSGGFANLPKPLNGTFSLWVRDHNTGEWFNVAQDSISNCGADSGKGRCYRTTVRDDGTADNGNSSRTIVLVNGSPGVFASVGRNYSDGRGTVTNVSSGTWEYFPSRDPQDNSGLPSSRGTVRVKLLFQEWREHVIPGRWEGEGKARRWIPEQRWRQWDTVSEQDNTNTCFTATCTVTQVIGGNWGSRPRDNAVRSGDTFTVKAKMTNTLPDSGPTRPPNLWENMYGFRLGLTSSENDSSGNRDHPLGYSLEGSGTQSQDVTMTFRASGNARTATYSLYPDYWGWTAIGPSCSFSVDVFEPFTISVNSVTANLTPDTENPNRFTYGARVCSSASVPVRLSSSGRAYKDPYAPGAETTYRNYSGGDYNNSCQPTWGDDLSDISGSAAGDKYCMYLSVNPMRGYIGPGGPGDKAEESGSYEDDKCPTVHDEPYIHAFGTDVHAGGGFGSSCTTVPGGINTFLTSTGRHPAGSGVQIGALAIGPINGFSSATLRDVAPLGSTGLSFSNTSNNTGSGSGSPALGGNLGGSHCVSDYFADHPDGTADTMPTASANLNSGRLTKYYEPAGGTLRISGGTIGNGAHEAIYVKGNVVIEDNITYASDNWGTPNNVPSFRIIASGNIYINSTVTRLDGLYVAQPSAPNQGGTIYTCTNGTTQQDSSGLYANCRRQLVVNGAFVSQKTFLDRTFSSRRHSSPGERIGTGVKPCGDSGSSTVADCAAEIFNFTPEMYMMRPDIAPSSGSNTGRFDYITSLSPVL